MAEYKVLLDPNGNKWNMRSNQPTRSFGMRFTVMFTERVLPLAQDRTANAMAMPALVWCFHNLSFDRFNLIDTKAMAEELGVSRPTISRCLNDLRDREFLERQGSGPRQTWKLTPEGGWRGTPTSFHKSERVRAEAKKRKLTVIEGDKETTDALMVALEEQGDDGA